MCPCLVQPPPLGLAYCPDRRACLRRNWDVEAGRTPLVTGGETEAGTWVVTCKGWGSPSWRNPGLSPNCQLLGLKTWAPGSLFPRAGANHLVGKARSRLGCDTHTQPMCESSVGPHPSPSPALKAHKCPQRMPYTQGPRGLSCEVRPTGRGLAGSGCQLPGGCAVNSNCPGDQ